jgi:hypothetical protein
MYRNIGKLGNEVIESSEIFADSRIFQAAWAANKEQNTFFC